MSDGDPGARGGGGFVGGNVPLTMGPQPANFMMVSFCLIDGSDAICISMETKIAPNKKKVFIQLELVATRPDFFNIDFGVLISCVPQREGDGK